MSSQNEIETLEIFILSVDELSQSKFIKEVEENGIGTGIHCDFGSGTLTSYKVTPELDSLKAFVLTIRFFRQNNEPTSLSRMEQMILSLKIDKALKREFSDTRKALNAYLDEEPDVIIEGIKALNTRRDIFETFLYGRFAHANREKRKTLKNLMESVQAYDDMEAIFNTILVQFLTKLKIMREVCQKIKAELER